MDIYTFEVGVIGGGIAGCEAAIASACLERKTALLSINLDSIVNLPGDNLFGGGVKNNLLGEIEELKGYLPENIKSNCIYSGEGIEGQIRLVDRRNFFLKAKHYLELIDKLAIRQAEVVKISPSGENIEILTKTGECFRCNSVVLALGTYLRAEVSWGEARINGGRYGDRSSIELMTSLKELNLIGNEYTVRSSPRLNGDSIDYRELEIVEPDKKENMENSFKVILGKKDISNILEYLSNFKEDNRYSCFPSFKERLIEEKSQVVLYIRPEGKNTEEISLEGARMNYPLAAQERVVKFIPGLRNAVLSRPGYMVKYQTINPGRLKLSLETKPVEGLFTAGQINGTSGYEEAAAQGLIAGINAALKARGEEPFILERSQAYIGLLIDDLVTKGIDEPYRMFTSRAEHRLLLRSDNKNAGLRSFRNKIEKKRELGI